MSLIFPPVSVFTLLFDLLSFPLLRDFLFLCLCYARSNSLTLCGLCWSFYHSNFGAARASSHRTGVWYKYMFSVYFLLRIMSFIMIISLWWLIIFSFFALFFHSCRAIVYFDSTRFHKYGIRLSTSRTQTVLDKERKAKKCWATSYRKRRHKAKKE